MAVTAADAVESAENVVQEQVCCESYDMHKHLVRCDTHMFERSSKLLLDMKRRNRTPES